MERIAVEAPLRVWTSATSNTSSAYIVIAGEKADALRLAALTGQWLDSGKRGFGSARVTVTIGETVWQTSIFPEKQSGGWFLPVKKAVRDAEELDEGALVRAEIAL
jgi:hypothetical protein